MNKLIPPTIKMDNPNEPILIYEGLADVIYKGHVENVGISIFQSWLPTPQVKFNFEIEALPVSLLNSDGKTIEINSEGFFRWKVIVLEIIENEKVYFSGILENPIFTGDTSSEIIQLNFTLFNFRSYFGNNFKFAEKSKRTGEITFETKEHSILIHSVNSINNQNKAQRKEGGYIFTNACRIKFKEPASYEKVEYLRKRLGLFLSFINGRRSYPRFIKAYADSGDLLWEDHSSCHIDIYKLVVFWMPLKIEKPFTDLWANFLSITKNEDDFEKISLIIHWYLEALNNSGHSKGSIIMLQTVFEILYNWRVNEEKIIEPYTKNKAEQGQASNKIRAILAHYNLSLSLPKAYNEFFKDIRFIGRNGKEKETPYDFCFLFTEIRNIFIHFSNVHNENRKKLPDFYDWYLLNTAIFNLEVILLKMMDYKGLITSRLLVDQHNNSNQVSIKSPYEPISFIRGKQ